MNDDVVATLQTGKERVAMRWGQRRNLQDGFVCAWSALWHTGCSPETLIAATDLLRAALGGISLLDLFVWNDHRKRRVADVLDLYEDAIRLAKKGE